MEQETGTACRVCGKPEEFYRICYECAWDELMNDHRGA